ncbi:MAG TPA: hypothetical protein VFR03_07605 [Thermoanaerobaculia bacterium]|nr:hypothetical protein [Thermoanaerobaculia bacterium]
MRKTQVPFVLAFAAVRGAVALALGFHPFDDTYITFRYALNLALGHGFVYNFGERVLGTTTPLWALLLAGCRWLGAPIPPASQGIALAADAASALLILRMLRRLGFPQRVALGAAVLFLSLFDGLSLARSGMETSLFILLTLAAFAATAEGWLALAGLAAGLACLTRPEGLALLPVLLAAGLVRWRRTEARRDALLGALLLGATLGAWILFATSYFGSVVPQSIIAKASHVAHDPSLAGFSRMNLALFLTVGQFGGGIFERTWLQLNFLLTLLSAFAALWLGVAAARERSEAAVLRFALPVLFPMGYIAGLAASHAFTWFPWYYGPIYPFAAMLAMIGIDGLADRLRPWLGARARWLAPAGLTLLVAAQTAAAVLVKLPRDHDFVVTGYLRSAAAIPPRPGVRVAALEVGAVGWRVWPLPVTDLLGLVSPEAVGHLPEETLRAGRPQYFCLRTDDGAPLLARVASQGWFADSYERFASVPDPRGAREFVVYRRRSLNE